MTQEPQRFVRLHLTNVVGLGAVRLAQSLLPAILKLEGVIIKSMYLPDTGELSRFNHIEKNVSAIRYKRYLPNIISRLLECTILGRKFGGETPLLVFGDIPIRCKATQTVFVQTPLLIEGQNNARKLGSLKYKAARWLFRRNQSYASHFIVQTEWMKSSLIETYPEVRGRVHVIGQPAPPWLTQKPRGVGHKLPRPGTGLRLFYPAASYPHKNHKLLSGINDSTDWPISRLVLTIPESQNPNPSIPWIHCVGRLVPEQVVETYGEADALLFLSYSESLGFPLIEAMSLQLPIICPDFPYAHAICGDTPIYFDPYDLQSLKAAVIELESRLNSGWSPDYSEPLKNIPRDWEEVAERMVMIAAGKP